MTTIYGSLSPRLSTGLGTWRQGCSKLLSE